MLRTDDASVIFEHLLRNGRFHRQLLLAVGTSGQPNEDLSLFPLVMGMNGIVVIFKGKVVFGTLFNPETVFGNLLQGLRNNIPQT